MTKSQRKSELRLGDAPLIGSAAVTATQSITDCFRNYFEQPPRRLLQKQLQLCRD
jgi:hypothetical protein